ncbi:uncharacterized protein BYT42DRAFT_34676 [Radiomyces spectabilis]|uniref:uncharacterized protein n=1 Tax=Radiomyces spectabilis TaxID=64574 RepID=UPI00221E4897|nr:uncharacterized protein BYT42DRAFT_34676 [Radiomyces spectabilis]KAI8394201.1 hypothetical protein BYT42DRAFT_34676 [Radiomyces spectabilis]
MAQWSMHKPGVNLNSIRLEGFPPPPPFSPPKPFSSPKPPSPSEPPRPTSNPSTSSLSKLSISSGRSGRFSSIAINDNVTQSLLSMAARAQLVAFSADTEYIFCAATVPDSPASVSSSSSVVTDPTVSESVNNNNRATHGTIYHIPNEKPALKLVQQPFYQRITAVDWTTSSNACLVGSIDGSVKVTSLIKI